MSKLENNVLKSKSFLKNISDSYGAVDYMQDIAKDLLIGLGVSALSDSYLAGLVTGGGMAIVDTSFFNWDCFYPKLRKIYHGVKDLAFGALTGKLVNDNLNNIPLSVYTGLFGAGAAIGTRLFCKEKDEKMEGDYKI